MRHNRHLAPLGGLVAFVIGAFMAWVLARTNTPLARLIGIMLIGRIVIPGIVRRLDCDQPDGYGLELEGGSRIQARTVVVAEWRRLSSASELSPCRARRRSRLRKPLRMNHLIL